MTAPAKLWIVVDADGGQVGGFHTTQRDAERSIPPSERAAYKFLPVDADGAREAFDAARAEART